MEEESHVSELRAELEETEDLDPLSLDNVIAEVSCVELDEEVEKCDREWDRIMRKVLNVLNDLEYEEYGKECFGHHVFVC